MEGKVDVFKMCCCSQCFAQRPRHPSVEASSTVLSARAPEVNLTPRFEGVTLYFCFATPASLAPDEEQFVYVDLCKLVSFVTV